MSESINFEKLIADYKIEIPIIQRDYAQGREDTKAKEIRTNFVQNIKNSVAEGQAMNLDFIYGTVDTVDQERTLTLLDGQQRITTLFLIHVYLSHWMGETRPIDLQTLSKFTYRTRPSAGEFCNALVKDEATRSFKEAENCLSDSIGDAPWFYSVWRKDPTVRSMLTVLDVIHDEFHVIVDEFKETAPERIKNVKFHFLKMDNYGLGDELYIKMNSRGVHLSEFENFKAWFYSHIEKREALSSDIEGWQKKVDKEWTDFIWSLPASSNGERVKQFDTYYLRYFKEISILFYLSSNDFKTEGSGENDEKKDLVNNFLDSESFTSTAQYEKVFDADENVKFTLETLDRIEEHSGELEDALSHVDVFQDKQDEGNHSLFCRVLGGKPALLQDRLLLFSLALYLENNDDSKISEEKLKGWLRVTRNLILNSSVSIKNLEKRATFLNKLSSHWKKSKYPDNIYSYLGDLDPNEGYLDLNSQLGLVKPFKEEQTKAKIIVNGPSPQWMDAIIDAEDHPFFEGQIAGLLNMAEIDKSKEFDIRKFEHYRDLAKAIFVKDGIVDNEEYILQRSLLLFPRGNSNDQHDNGVGQTYFIHHKHFIFKIGSLIKRDEGRSVWREFLNDSDRPLILKDLFNKLFPDPTVTYDNARMTDILEDTLKERIAELESEPRLSWVDHLIRESDTWSFVRVGFIRRDDARDSVRLMSKSTMGSRNTELRVYSLFKKLEREGSILFKDISEPNVTNGGYVFLSISEDFEVLYSWDETEGKNLYQIYKKEGEGPRELHKKVQTECEAIEKLNTVLPRTSKINN